jgi:2-methylcitrate dehydratase PrpD
MVHVTEILSRYIADLQYEDFPESVVETTKMYILDYYAACFAGIKINDKFNRILEDIFFDEEGKKEYHFLYVWSKFKVGSTTYSFQKVNF